LSHHILLVEDDSLLRHAFLLLLEDAGYRISEAGTAGEAIAAAMSDTPDLVLLDLGLPDGNGLDVCRTLRQREAMRAIPIIALTGRAGPEQKQECLDAGCTSFFPKPIEPKLLIKRLREFLPQ